MYNLPADFPLDAYVGQRVAHLMEGAHFVELKFEAQLGEKAYVQFEGPVVLKIPGAPEHRIENEELVEGNVIFQPLLGTTISGVDRVSDRSCRFSFSNGWRLDLIGGNGFESYHLNVAGSCCDV